jgi:tRNA A-37 threonylcarbamoyl transferase component Bud32/tetratricopeptide (TPR) repeat protein
MRLSTHDKLGPYTILAAIGAGGMGEVYRARDTKLGRHVAIKVLPDHLAADSSARERLRREAQAAASLDHPFICKVFEIGEVDGAVFLVMEFIAGETLHERLSAGALPLAEALRIAREVGEALEEAHRHRFLHRDLKPANVMLTQGHAKVMDFGLARQFETSQPKESADTVAAAEPGLTGQGIIVGTPDYMSPEQVRGDPLDQRSDLFSFGILLCDLLGGAHPFRRATPTETMAAILRDPPSLAGDIPPGLMVLVRRLLAKELDQRYLSMREVLADLERTTTTSLAARETVTETPIPLIGREPELAELKRALDEAMAGRGSTVMIGGEPGIGKTHLTGAILEEARRRGAFGVVGHCYEGEGAPPYIPYIETLETVVRMAPREAFRMSMGEDAPEIAKLMPELRAIYPDMPPAIQLPPEQQRRFLFNAYRSWLERAVRITPALVVFEDLHWADEPTLLLLQHLAQTQSSMALLTVCTYRDMELDVTRPFAKTLETLLRQKQATRISLRRLPVSGVEGMLAAMSGQKPPPSLARVIFAETEGNPFFVEEVFRHLSEEGMLFDQSGKWLPGLRVDQLQVPEGVRLVLGRRLDRLGEDARRVLTTAAVVGRSFSLRLLEELENKQADAALDAVEEAEKAHLLVAEPAGRDTRYRFVHELVRHTLAESLSLPRRQRIHARVADAIERVYAANLEAQASPLAHHLYQAGVAADPEKTTTYLLIATRRAREAAAHEEALAHLDNALSLWEGEPSARVAELMEQRAGALRSMGRIEESIAGYQKAIDLFEAAGAMDMAAQANLQLFMIHAWRIDFDAGNRVAERGLKYLAGADLRLKVSLLMVTFLQKTGTGNAAAAALVLAQIKEVYQAAGIPFGGLPALAELHFLWQSGQFVKIVDAYQPVATEFQANGDRWSEAEVSYMGLGSEMFCGRPSIAARGLPEALANAEKIGHHGAAWAAKSIGGTLALARGDLAAAGKETIEAWEFGEAHQVGWRLVSRTHLAFYAFLRGDLESAERWCLDPTGLERGTYLAAIMDSTRFVIIALAGDHRAAEAWAARSWELPVTGQVNSLGAWIALANSVVGLASMGRKEEAAALRLAAEEMAHTCGWASRSFSPNRTVAGIAAACAGDWPAAEKHHLTAIHQMDTAPFKNLQPVAREWYADMLLERNAAGDRDKARALLSEVVAMYKSMGMTFPAKLIHEKLAAL